MVTAGAEQMHQEDVASEEEVHRQMMYLWDEFTQLEGWRRWSENNAPNEEEVEEIEIAMWNRQEEAQLQKPFAAQAPPPPPPPQPQCHPGGSL